MQTVEKRGWLIQGGGWQTTRCLETQERVQRRLTGRDLNEEAHEKCYVDNHA